MKKNEGGKNKPKKKSQSASREDFLIVGIGASVEDVQFLKEFFRNVSPDSGLAFVVILHLSPGYESSPAEVLQAVAPIPVTQVKKRVRVKPDHIYFIPPNRHLTMNDGVIELTANSETEDLRAPVDRLFRTLAEPSAARAVAVILSGTGANGSMRLKRVRERGGNLYVEVNASGADLDGERLVLEIVRDAAERRKSEDVLLESEERFRFLIESAKDYAIFTLTPDGIINSWNAGAEKIFGWTEAEIIGKPSEIIFTAEDRAKGVPAKELKTALRKGRAPDERFHIRKDGVRFYVSGVVTLLRDANGKLQGFVKIARDLTERLEAEKAIRDKEMLQKLVGALEDERRRIARDLHDELGQKLTSLRLNLEKIRKMSENEAMSREIDKIGLLAKSIDKGIDFLAWELRPAALDQLGLIPALDNYVKQWTLFSGVRAELLASRLKKRRFVREIETNLYRIVQEALNNIYKHAGANNVEVLLERRGDLIVLIIQDDGRGFNVKNKKTRGKGIGLIGMEERAALVRGTLEIESAPGEGTTIFVRVPALFAKRGGSDGK
ncbi:MAG: PAS domain S-box protein [Pyrinomonadaceae bacterium]|nr:PAS domain S-box protein [Pyrinomonadaceae bacterium]